jgi:hypothetical protein
MVGRHIALQSWLLVRQTYLLTIFPNAGPETVRLAVMYQLDLRMSSSMDKVKKVLFLDLDGVLNSERSFLAGAYRTAAYHLENPKDPYYLKITTCTIDPIACGLVNRICRELDVSIVISSTHRMHFKDGPEKLNQIKNYFNNLGVGGEYIVDYTMRLGTIRGLEIDEWLKRHPDITHYAILDDSSDMLEEQMKNFVRCNLDNGMSTQNYRQLYKIFGGTESLLITP